MSFYNRDDSLPYWQNYVDAESIFQAFAHRPERAKAWLRYRNVSETCSGFERAVMMHGHFEGGILHNHTYSWTFTPGRRGDLAIVVPVVSGYRLVDFVAISRHDDNVWGCCTGTGQFVGQFVSSTLNVHQTPISWLASGDGVLPLAKSFFPLLQFANNIVARNGDHAWDIANQTFIYPAERLGLDCESAERSALDRISFDEAAA
jgi:hypothetical protein